MEVLLPEVAMVKMTEVETEMKVWLHLLYRLRGRVVRRRLCLGSRYVLKSSFQCCCRGFIVPLSEFFLTSSQPLLTLSNENLPS